MEYKDFYPIVYEKRNWLFPCCIVCSLIDTDDTKEIVKQRMNDWLKENKHRIYVLNIETFDFTTCDWILKRSHYRVWYSIEKH